MSGYSLFNIRIFSSDNDVCIFASIFMHKCGKCVCTLLYDICFHWFHYEEQAKRLH